MVTEFETKLLGIMMMVIMLGMGAGGAERMWWKLTMAAGLAAHPTAVGADRVIGDKIAGGAGGAGQYHVADCEAVAPSRKARRRALFLKHIPCRPRPPNPPL